MKTIVLFFVLFAFAAVTAKHSKKQKGKEHNDEDVPTHDWPQPETVGEYGVPEGYDGPAASGGQGSGAQPGGNGGGDDTLSGKSHVRSSRRHN